MSGKRTAIRRRTFKAGTIEFTGSGGRIACTVRNISETGAAIELEGLVATPRDLSLTVENVSRPCHVVWRKEKRLGVTFR